MIYEYIREEFYGRTLFCFNKIDQPIIVAFEPEQVEDTYLVIVFSEDGNNIKNPHEPNFAETLDAITVDFANGRDLLLNGAAI